MTRRLPPLTSLRAFEAAARHLSFSKAADELGVTPAAVSHQVKGLEEDLGTPLFRRFNRAVRLTEAGQVLLPGLSEGFERLAAAVDQVRAEERSGILTVSTGPAFAGKWLVPRLERFQARHPEIDVRIDASVRLVDLRRDRVDVAVRFGRGAYPGLSVERLFDESVVPMCSPRLMAGPHPLTRPEDLRHHVLLHDDMGASLAGMPDWRSWLAAAGVDGVDWTRGPHFSQADHALQAAADGLGVLLGRRRLAAADIAAGRLVVPFDLVLRAEFSFYLVCLPEAAERPKIRAFRDWIRAEAATS